MAKFAGSRCKASVIALIVATTLALSACGPSPEEQSAAIEQAILSTQGTEELWTTVKEAYPRDFADLVERVRSLDAGDAQDEAAARQVTEAWLREFFERIGPDAVKASAPEIIAWSAKERDLYYTLQTEAVGECAAMTMGEWIFIEDKSSASSAAIAGRNTSMVRASASGRDDPQTYSEPSEEDFSRLGEAISATGLDPDLQAALGSDEAMAALTQSEQCAAGVAFYQALSALPDDIEAPLAAHMLSPR